MRKLNSVRHHTRYAPLFDVKNVIMDRTLTRRSCTQAIVTPSISLHPYKLSAVNLGDAPPAGLLHHHWTDMQYFHQSPSLKPEINKSVEIACDLRECGHHYSHPCIGIWWGASWQSPSIQILWDSAKRQCKLVHEWNNTGGDHLKGKLSIDWRCLIWTRPPRLCLPGENIKCLLYSSVKYSASISQIERLLVLLMISNNCLTLANDSRLILVNHDVDPVPVLTHRPELLVLFNSSLLSIWICKCETRAAIVSPINTYENSGRDGYFWWDSPESKFRLSIQSSHHSMPNTVESVWHLLYTWVYPRDWELLYRNCWVPLVLDHLRTDR